MNLGTLGNRLSEYEAAKEIEKRMALPIFLSLGNESSLEGNPFTSVISEAVSLLQC